MKVCYFYAKKFQRAIDALPADTELIYTGDGQYHYWRELSSRWGQDMIVIEQDSLLSAGVIEELTECPSLWCTFPYRGLTESLGCTKFRKELPIAVEEIPASPMRVLGYNTYHMACFDCQATEYKEVCWKHIDLRIMGVMQTKGIKVCVHEDGWVDDIGEELILPVVPQ